MKKNILIILGILFVGSLAVNDTVERFKEINSIESINQIKNEIEAPNTSNEQLSKHNTHKP